MLEQQLVVGRTYRFTFKSEFERHGVCPSGVTCLHKGNGVFTLEQISTYPDLVLSGVSIYESFFKPLKISEEEFQQYFSGRPTDSYTKDYVVNVVPTETTSTEVVYSPTGGSDSTGGAKTVQRKTVGLREQVVESGKSLLKKRFLEDLTYASYPIYKLVDVVDSDDVLYVPEKAIKGFPEVGIMNYQDMTLSIDLGFWDDPAKLDGVLRSVRERLAIHGIQPLNIEMFSADEKWMNPDEYAEIKETRVPGNLVKITETNAPTYVGDVAVIDGELKTIVAGPISSTDKNAENQVSTGTLMTTKSKVIDPTTFIRETDPATDVLYESGKLYYRKENLPSESGANLGVQLSSNPVGYRRYIESEDWLPGDKIVHYIGVSSKPTTGKYYKKWTNNKTKNYKSVLDAFREQEDSTVTYIDVVYAYIEAGNKIFRDTTVYTQCLSDETAVAGTTYYERIEDHTFSVKSVTIGSPVANYFTKGNEGPMTQVDMSYITAHTDEGYYVLIADEVYEDITGNSLPSGESYYVRDMIYVSDYSKQDAIDLLSKRYKYTNALGSLTEVELTAQMIVDLALEQSTELRIANDIAYRKYAGRMFEYSTFVKCSETDRAQVGITYYKNNSEKGYYIPTDGQPATNSLLIDGWYRKATFDIIVAAATYSHYKDMPGYILGNVGELWKDTYIKNDNLRKNYYALYMESLQRETELMAEVAALRAIVIAQNSSSAN